MAVEVNKAYLLGEYSLKPDQRELSKGNESLHLASRPFQVLLYLIDHRDRVVTRSELLDRFWDGKDVYEETLTKCVGAIRRVLNDGLDGRRFIETRYAEGYRYIGPLKVEFFPTPTSDVEIETTRAVKIIVEEEQILDSAPTFEPLRDNQNYAATIHSKAPRSPARTAALALALIALALTASGLFIYQERGRSVADTETAEASSSRINSLAVLPLKNLTGDPAQDYLSDGITESLITQLAKIDSLKVISQNSTLTFKGRDVDPREAARRLNVGAVLEGTLRTNGDSLRVAVRLVNASDGHIIWASDTYERAQRDVFTLEEEIACNIAEGLRAKLCGDVEPLPRTSKIEAYRAYLKGRFFISQETSPLGPEGALKRAIEYFQQAISIDPAYAPAYAGLADSYTQLNWFVAEDPRSVIAKAKAAALKAVELDDASAEAHTALATALLHDWDFADSEREHQRAIALNPGIGWAYHEYSTYLGVMGRREEELAALKKAQELDPLNPTIMADEASSLYRAHLYDEAIAMFRNVCVIDPTCNQVEVANANIGMCYLAKGMPDEAIRNLEAEVKTNGRNPDSLVWLGIGYAASGRKKEATQILNEITRMAQKQYVPKVFLALIYTALDERDQALKMLERAYVEHDINLLSLGVNELLSPLRSERRFQDLLRRVGLPS